MGCFYTNTIKAQKLAYNFQFMLEIQFMPENLQSVIVGEKTNIHYYSDTRIET